MGFQEVGEAYLLSQSKPGSPESWPTALDMALACSKLMSLAEGQPMFHGIEMAVLAGSLAFSLIKTDKERRLLMQSALLHDVGVFQLMGRLSPGQEELLPSHCPMVCKRQEAEISGLERHLIFPGELIRLLHLDGDIARWVAFHHLFADQSGLVPEIPALERPTLGMNLLTFCDCLLAEMGRSTSYTGRYELAQAFLENQPPELFYPEIPEAFRMGFDSPETLKLLDHRTLTQSFIELYPDASTSPSLNGIEILLLCRWMATQTDARQPKYTLNEAAATADLMAAMGTALELPLESIGQLVLAGLLHDVGKLAIPLALLNSERTLSRRDQEQMVLHAKVVEEIFSSIPGFEALGFWMGAHHERLNGSGYPYGRRGHELAVGARLLAIADTFISLTRPRPFRPMAYRPKDALEILKNQQGRIYDPSLLQVLETLVRQRERGG